MNRLFIFLSLLLSLCSVCGAQVAAAPDFSAPRSWYGGVFESDKRVDVLFFPPTSVSDRDGQGRNMNPANEAQRLAMDYWYATAKALWGSECNFYGPYYRQVTMESWGKPYFNQTYAIALEDVLASFDYYMKHLNGGRPFILAGHSQGARLVYSLIKKRINVQNYPKMVAAYPIGYRVSAQDLKESKYIVPARNAFDTGVCISYHTASSSETAMFPGNAMNINPLSWTTGSELAPASMNLGSVFVDLQGRVVKESKGVISAQIDPKTGCVIARGVAPKEYYKPYLGGYYFRLGNYHLQDMNFYFRNLQQNVHDRIESYYKKVGTN